MWNVLHHENNENYVILYISQINKKNNNTDGICS